MWNNHNSLFCKLLHIFFEYYAHIDLIFFVDIFIFPKTLEYRVPIISSEPKYVAEQLLKLNVLNNFFVFRDFQPFVPNCTTLSRRKCDPPTILLVFFKQHHKVTI